MKILRALAALAIASTFAPGASAAGASPAVTAANAAELPIVAELNRVRAAHGLLALRTAAPLRRAADAHAASMAGRGYFAHASADGTSFDRRIARFYPPVRFSRWIVGENLLYGPQTLTAKEAVAMWMRSPGHRRNILAPAYREIGIAAVRVQAAPGVFGGGNVLIVVTDFGARR